MELAIAISILLIGMVSVVTASSRMHSVNRQNRDRTLAQNALRSMAARMQANALQFASTPESPPLDTFSRRFLGAWGPASGNDRFAIRGLNNVPGEDWVGTITIVTDETATDADLGFEVGMPRDLNGDGAADDDDVTGDARLLPVLLTARWHGVSGDLTQRHAFYVMAY